MFLGIIYLSVAETPKICKFAGDFYHNFCESPAGNTISNYSFNGEGRRREGGKEVPMNKMQMTINLDRRLKSSPNRPSDSRGARGEWINKYIY